MLRAGEIGEPQTAGEQAHDKERASIRSTPRRRGRLFVARVGLRPVRSSGSIWPRLIGHRYISSTGSTPNTASPEAITIATPRTRAQARAGQRRVGGENEAQRRIVLALGPQQVELRRDLLQIEGDAVRLVRLGRALDEARPAGELADQRELGRLGEPVERRRGQRRIGSSARRKFGVAWRSTEEARACAYCT